VEADFHGVSLVIDIRGDVEKLDGDVLWRPGRSGKRTSRIIFHEAIHYWQQMSQSYLVRLSEERWERLIAFERSDRDRGPGPLAKEFDRRLPAVGASPRELHEGLARFWDTIAFGPDKVLEFEWSEPDRLANPELVDLHERMRGGAPAPSGAWSGVDFIWAMSLGAGNYARPFNEFLERVRDPFAAACLFPLLAHFALQTTKPAEMYGKFVDVAAPRLLKIGREGAEFSPPYGIDHHESAMNSLYIPARTQCDRIARAEGDRLTMGFEAFLTSSLGENPAYRWAFGSRMVPTMLSLARTRDARRAADALFGGRRGDDLAGQLLLDGALATPGLKDSRLLLLLGGVLAPPCWRLESGEMVLAIRQWREAWVGPPTGIKGPNLLTALVPMVERPDVGDEEEAILASCTELDERWQVMQRRATRDPRHRPDAKFGSPSDP
jgi:hypothetical protein